MQERRDFLKAMLFGGLLMASSQPGYGSDGKLDWNVFIERFPDKHKIPKGLRECYDHSDASGWLHIRPQEFAFDQRHQPADQFGAVQLADYNGEGRIGLWLAKSAVASQNSPVVFVDDEGVDCKTIASDFLEFLKLLAIGFNDVSAANPKLAPITQDLREFRSWIKAAFGISVPESDSERLEMGTTILKVAARDFPDFQSWRTSKRAGAAR
jgi:hypothetical protein